MTYLIRLAALAIIGTAGTAFAASPPTDPAGFVNAAAQAGMMEVEAGKLALAATTNAAVKTFANRMITDHGKANVELAAIAKKEGIVVPGTLDAEHAKMLQGLRQEAKKDFDAAYASHMVQDHANAVALFQANVQNADSPLSAFAGKTLPTLQEHKRLADNLKANLGK